MRFHEYQAKQIFKEQGIPTPEGEVASTAGEARDIAESLGGSVAVKAQVHVGGRGKAGGIEVVDSAEEAEEAARRIIGMDLKGKKVNKVLVEEAVDIDEEFYVGVTLDRGEGRAVAMVSSKGGVDIESVAEESPEAIASVHIDPAYDLQPFQAREVAYGANIPGEAVRGVTSILLTIYNLWKEKDAQEAEINPLVMTSEGDLIAADGVFNVDDSALYRQEKLAELEEEAFEDKLEAKASGYGLDYVRLEGDTGVIGNGAGLVMATLDLIDYYNGSPSNFLDVGGGADAERVSHALELVFDDENAKAIIFNIFGGITRCDEVARGINQALPKEVPKPVVVRLTGTNEKEGREILTDKVEEEQKLEDAVKKAIELSGGS